MMRALFLIILATVVACHGAVLEERNFPDGAAVRLVAPINVMPSGGFYALRVELSNPGPESLSFTLQSEATLQPTFRHVVFRGNANDPGRLTSRFDLGCPPGETRQVDLLVPVLQASDSDERYLSLSLSNGEGRPVFSTVISSDTGKYRFGISNQVYGRFSNEIRSGWRASKGSRGPSSFSDLSGTFDPVELPTDWRAYGGYDLMIFSRADLEAVLPGVRVALDQWVRSGGHLIVLNDGSPEDGGQTESRQDGFGKRTILECGEDYQAFDPRELWISGQTGPAPLTEINASQYRAPSWRLAEALGSRTLQTGLLLFALIIFAVVVGPVNLFVWTNKNRRHRLFVTTPVISVVASLIMVAFIIFRDGFGGDGARAIAIEVGSPEDKSAVILQEQFSRSGILFSSGFSLDDQSLLIPLRPPETDLNRADSPSSQGTFQLEMVSTDDGWEVSGNLFESRSEQAQLVRSVVPSREGLALVSGAGEDPRLSSSFSYDLGPVFFTDGEGEVWKAASVGPGEAVTFGKSSLYEREEALKETLARFGDSNEAALQRMMTRRNSFAALAEDASGVETHTSMDWQESPVLVTGLTTP